MSSITIGPPAVATKLFAILGLAFAAACGGKDAQQANNQQPREIQLAPSSAAPSALNDAPAKAAPAPEPAPEPKRTAPAPRRPAPAPAPPEQRVVVTPITPAPIPAPAPAAPAVMPTGTIDAGRTLSVHPAARICTNTHKVGDRFTASLGEAVQASNGVAIPAGSDVVLRVVESARSQNSKDNIKLTFDVVSVRVGDDTYDVLGTVATATPLEKVRAQSTGDQAKKVGTGAVIGAIAGQILGRNTRSTVVGGAVGAAAGAAVAAGTADYDGCIPTTGTLSVTLTQALRIKAVARAP